MAATKSQGTNFTLFMAGLTAVCAGIAFSSSGVAKVALIVGVVALVVSLWGFFKIKPLEGKTGGGPQPAVMKLIGVAVVLGGLAVRPLWIAPHGQCWRAFGHFDCGLCRLPGRNLLHSGARGEQERYLEGLIALPNFPWRCSTQSWSSNDENCTLLQPGVAPWRSC